MKNKKSSTKVSWHIWVPVIAAVVTGCFLLINTLISKSQSNEIEPVQTVNEQKVDSGSINNYNAQGDINFNYTKSKDSVVNTPVKNAIIKPHKGSNNKQKSTINGNNNNSIQGNNNTVIVNEK